MIPVSAPDYEQIMFKQYQDCRQGSKTVETFLEEFHKLSSQNNLLEIEAQQVARFVGGLHWAIQDRVAMQTVYTLTEAVAMAIKVETQLDRSKAMVGVAPPKKKRKLKFALRHFDWRLSFCSVLLIWFFGVAT